MTALAVRHETGRRRRFDRRDGESRTTQLDHLRDLIARDEYAVDAEKVAEAMLRRLMLEAKPRSG
jgi:anti-sigma28 factor (negative regulator of flagellin synthesis)